MAEQRFEQAVLSQAAEDYAGHLQLIARLRARVGELVDALEATASEVDVLREELRRYAEATTTESEENDVLPTDG